MAISSVHTAANLWWGLLFIAGLPRAVCSVSGGHTHAGPRALSGAADWPSGGDGAVGLNLWSSELLLQLGPGDPGMKPEACEALDGWGLWHRLWLYGLVQAL